MDRQSEQMGQDKNSSTVEAGRRKTVPKHCIFIYIYI